METKVCSSCGQEKEISEFYSQKHHKYGVMSMCKSCFNKICMERWKQRKIKYIQSLGGKCEHCGIELNNTNSSIFDFHHTNPLDKEYVWTKLRLLTDNKIETELSKCKLLCANCHRLEHYSE